MSRALGAGATYFALAFAAGFLLGSVRVIALEPALGGTAAVALELPVMLAISWLACGWTLRRWRVSPAPAHRLVMGLSAFGLLMAAETATGMLLMGRTAAQQWEAVLSPAGRLGLAAQIAFAAFPLLRRRGGSPA